MTQHRRWVLGGGLASGKSKVRELLTDAGVATIDADAVGHEVLANEESVFEAVAGRWPSVIFDKGIDRRRLATIVFNDPGELEALESITHPHIFDRIRERVEQIEATVVVEVPVINHGLGEGWQRVVVDCRDEVRLERAIARGLTEADSKARMSRQPTRPEWLAVADLVVPNHGSVGDLAREVAPLVSHL
ncbi:MAG TPA: dephospho-CoA kinase [Acidimicrobiia bacterium]|nr:dephospho-CoA kinase [Acidimicrobiia bacterium]